MYDPIFETSFTYKKEWICPTLLKIQKYYKVLLKMGKLIPITPQIRQSLQHYKILVTEYKT